MIKILRSLAVVALMAIPWMASGQCTDYATIPYTTGFEGIATDSLPACWTQIKTGVNGSHTFPSVYEYSPNTRNGSCYFEFEASASSSDTEIVALPLMQNISGLKLTMWVSSSSSYACTLEVGVMEDSVFVPVDTLNLITFSGASGWKQNYHEYTTYFVNYTGSGERMAIRAVRSGSGQYTLFIDDITVSEDNGCYPLSNLAATYADSSSITVSWSDEMNTGATYTVTYWKNGGDTTVDNNVYDTSYTATGLDASSTYNFIVTPNCLTGDGIPVSGSFRTTCGILMVPFTEGFDNADALECWSRVACASSTGYFSGNTHSGAGCFRFYWNTTPPQYLISPQLGGTENDGVVLSFWYKKYSTSYTENFKVGYSLTDTDDSSFVWSADVNPTTTYQEYTATYPAGVKYIAIKYLQNNGYYLYIDDLSVSIDNGCNKPDMAVVDSVGPYDAYLRWTNGGLMASSYNLYYGTQNNIDSADVVSGLTDTAYHLTGLLPQTTYYAWVMTDCGGDVSDAKAFGSFTTELTCAPLTGVTMGDISYTAAVINWGYNTGVGFPSNEVIITLTDNTDTNIAPVTVSATGSSYTFTGLEAGHGYTVELRNVCDADIQFDTAAGNTVSFMTTSCAEISGSSTTSYLPTYTYYNYSFGEMIYTASQMPNIDTIRGIAFNVVSSRTTTRTVDVYMGYSAYSDFSGGMSWISSDSLTLVASAKSLPASNTGWVVIPFDTNFFYDGTSNLVIAIDDNTGSWVSAPTWQGLPATNQGIYIYNDNTNFNPSSITSSGTVASTIPAIRFVADCEVPTCFAPMVTVDAVDSASISVHWNVVGVENSWQVGIKASTDASYTFAGPVTDTFYTFTGLNANTPYTVYVASLCDDTLPTTMTVRTACGPMAIPFFEDWESIPANGAWPACWDSILHHNTDPSVNWEYNHTAGGQYSMFLMASNDYNLVVSPTVPLAGDQITVNFWARMATSTSAWMKVGVMTNPHDTTTFVPLLTIPDHDGSFHEYEVNTTGLNPAATYHVAWLFYSTSTSYRGAIDDITIMQTSPCPRPNAAIIDSTDGTNIYLHWPSTGAASYEVAYATVNDVNDSSVQYVVVSDTNATIAGLDPMTQYYLWVRALCGSDNSNWRDAGSASTACDTTTCDVAIVMVDSYGDGWNGAAVEVYQAGMLMGTATLPSGSNATANISVCSSSPVEFRFQRGSYPSEVSMTIQDGGGATLYTQTDMSSVSNGTVLATTNNPCPTCITPNGLTMTAATTSAISVSWNAGSSSQWQVYLDSVYVDDVYTPSYTFTGLSISTAYTVSVRAVCAVGDTSSFATLTVRTSCGNVNVFPWNEGFEATGVLECWNQEGDGSWTVGIGDYNTSTGAHSGSYNAKIVHSSRGDITKLITPVLELTPGSPATLSFWHLQRSWTGDIDSLVVYYRSSLTDSWHRLAGYQGEISSWTKDSLSLPNTSATYQIAFEMHDDYGYGVAIDDITVDGISGGCPAPTVGNVNADVESVTVTFVASGDVELAIAQGNVTNPPATTYTTTAGSYTFTGLTPATTYTIFIRQMCADSTYSDWAIQYVTTLDLGCVPPTGLTVEGTSYTSATLSWTTVGEETAWQVEVFNSVFDSIYTVTTNPSVVAGLYPDFTYNARVRALCGTNNDIPGEWGTDTVTFSTNACPDVEGLTVTNVTANSADASWIATSGVMGYNVVWMEEEVQQGNVTVTNPTHHIDGLQPATTYRVLVKNICSEGASSGQWATAEFTTADDSEGIDDVASVALTLYPNPASTSVTLSFDASGNGAIAQIVDMNGREVSRYTMTAGSLTIDISNLACGAYFVRVTGDKATAVHRLIVR